MRNRILITMLAVILLMPFVSSHALKRWPEEKSTELYIVDFSTDPIFPVTNKEIHLDINVRDKNNNHLNNLKVDLELHKGKQTININTKISGFGHYDMRYKFSEAGEYKIHLSINGEELPIEFDLKVDSFGYKGTVQVSVLLFFALILLFLAYKDCRRNKNG